MRVHAVGHEASRTGAPAVMLALVRWLAMNTEHTVTITLAEGGPLLDDFADVDPDLVILNLSAERERWTVAERVLGRLHLHGLRKRIRSRRLHRLAAVPSRADVVYVSTAAALRALPPKTVPPVVLHAHEMTFALRSIFSHDDDATAVMALPMHVIAPTALVIDAIEDVAGVRPAAWSRVVEMFDDKLTAIENGAVAPAPGRVLGCGTAEWRKGTDLFLEAAATHHELFPGSDALWTWVGMADDDFSNKLRCRRLAQNQQDYTELLPRSRDVAEHFAGCSVFVLASREDPYPLVALAAAAAGRPVVCFAGSGGIPELIARGAGLIVPHGDVIGLARAVEELLSNPALADDLGRRGRQLVLEEHSTEVVAPNIVAILEQFETDHSDRLESGRT